jgi:hypothetical protein
MLNLVICKVTARLLKVKQGGAVWCGDGFVLDSTQCTWSLVVCEGQASVMYMYMNDYLFSTSFTDSDWCNVDSIATQSGLNGLGFEPRWGRDFLHPSRLAPRPTQLLVQWVLVLLPRGKVTRAWH